MRAATRSSTLDLIDVRWLTGFSGSNGWAVVTADDLILGTDGRYGDRALAPRRRHRWRPRDRRDVPRPADERLVEAVAIGGAVGLDPDVDVAVGSGPALAADICPRSPSPRS